MWMERQTSELWGRCTRLLSQLTSDDALAQPSVLFAVGLLRTEFQLSNVLFSSLWQLGRWKHNVSTATESLYGESLSHKNFSGKFWKIWAKCALHPQKGTCSYTCGWVKWMLLIVSIQRSRLFSSCTSVSADVEDWMVSGLSASWYSFIGV